MATAPCCPARRISTSLNAHADRRGPTVTWLGGYTTPIHPGEAAEVIASAPVTAITTRRRVGQSLPEMWSGMPPLPKTGVLDV